MFKLHSPFFNAVLKALLRSPLHAPVSKRLLRIYKPVCVVLKRRAVRIAATALKESYSGA